MSIKEDYKYQAEEYVERCNEQDLLDLIKIYRKTKQKWLNLKPGQFFLKHGGYGDMFKMEIIEVDVDERRVVYKDHSMQGTPVSSTEYPPDPTFDTEEELQEYVNNQPPSFF